MKLINVEYLEESSQAIFFNVELATTISVGSFWRSKYENKTIIKRAFLEKWNTNKGYSNNFQWSDNTGTHNYDNAIVQEMILKYEKVSSLCQHLMQKVL